MFDSDSLSQLFPTPEAIPSEHRLASPIHQRTYVVDGESLRWDGACKTVLSALFRTSCGCSRLGARSF